ncbi:MAG TPA: dihydroxyacetone kinase subunit DhaK [Acidocella sp.]|nr:dihydroxyacetone kinase subunit DhaK [Acidocella sp.]
MVADDVSLRQTVEPSRWRGIAGTVLVHKIAGATASSGASLEVVVEQAQAAASLVVTMGVGIGACTVPAAGRPGFSLDETEMELGLGIHGERGVSRVPLKPVDSIVDDILEVLTSERKLVSGSRIALLVNGLGGTSPRELAIVARHALQNLRTMGVVIERAWCGNFMTALEMPSFSLTILPADAHRLARLDAPASAPGWPGAGKLDVRHTMATIHQAATPLATQPGPLSGLLRTLTLRAATALEQQEASLTDLDSRAGDGDLGISMARGAEVVRAMPEDGFATPAATLVALSHALRRAVATIGELGGAKLGDRTMLDGRHFAAWLGLTPREHSTGGKQRLGKISKACNERLRTLTVVGAMSVIRVAKPGNKSASAWLLQLLERKLAAVALANKMAWIIWAMMARGETYRRRPIAA